MATSVSDQRTGYQPVLSTTADYLDFENDQANIRAGRRTQQAITNKQKWQSYFSSGAHKRARLSPEEDLRQVGEKNDPQFQVPIRRNRRSIPIRVVRRLTSKYSEDQYDPHTIPVLTKREQRRIDKREKRQLEKIEKHRNEELAAQRRQQYDQISHQLEAKERERQMNLPHAQSRRSMKDKVKDTIRKSAKIGRARSPSASPKFQAPDVPQYVPHVDDFESKSHIRSWFGPSDVEAPPPPPPVQTIPELPPAAELPAVSISPPYDFRCDAAKRYSDDDIDLNTLPPPIRSPSPCLSSTLRRGITLSETPPQLSHKQMQCDYCHDAIKLAGFHYACIVCDDGDRLYCAKCANDGRTCRHELIERTRNIKRHPTNPEPSHHLERRSLSLEKDSVVSSDVHVELSASPPVPKTSAPSDPTRSTSVSNPSSPKVDDSANTSPTSASSPTDVFREFETKRREQEIAFREKEVTLREREAMLREREAWTASRERDAALVQQLHAAAMLQRERSTEVGAQFMPAPSRQSSCSSQLHSVQPTGVNAAHSGAPLKFDAPVGASLRNSCSLHHGHSPYGARAESIRLHSVGKGKRANIELVSTVAALEASVTGTKTTDSSTRNHANGSKRKAPAAENKAPSKASGRKGQDDSRRRPWKKNTQQDPDDNDDSDDSNEGSPKRQKQESMDRKKPDKLFACPYFKFEPMRYAEGNTHELHYRGCAGGLFRDISRVKQHLKRVHHRPDLYCRRCFAVFTTNEALQEHSSQAEGCHAEPCPFPEKLDETQQNKIHVKRPGRDQSDLWYDIFRIIFPGVPVPDSPYIEPSPPKSSEQSVLEQFVRLFESKLDTSTALQPLLSSLPAREFIRAQMRQAMQETIRHVSTKPDHVPSVLVSPVSPAGRYEFPESRQSSHSSRASSAANWTECSPSTRQPLLSPVSPMPSLRPALKVTTQNSYNQSASSGSSLHSAKSQSSSQFPKVLSHVQDDVDGDKTSNSWRSGDDVYAMNAVVPEPISATSTRSGKSVTFATPPQFVASWRTDNDPATTWNATYLHDNVLAPDLTYFTNFDWSAENFAVENCQVQRPLHEGKHSRRVDSAYGTLSSQTSQSSMRQQQWQQHPQQQAPQPMLAQQGMMEPSDGQYDHSTCVDPQMLFVNPAEAGLNMPGISADLQAYLNRDNKARSRYQTVSMG